MSMPSKPQSMDRNGGPAPDAPRTRNIEPTHAPVASINTPPISERMKAAVGFSPGNCLQSIRHVLSYLVSDCRELSRGIDLT